jgi:hypothetical protein
VVVVLLLVDLNVFLVLVVDVARLVDQFVCICVVPVVLVARLVVYALEVLTEVL